MSLCESIRIDSVVDWNSIFPLVDWMSRFCPAVIVLVPPDEISMLSSAPVEVAIFMW